MTGRGAPGRDRLQRRPLDLAARHRERAARMEMAAGRRIERRGDLALDRLEAAPADVDPRHLLEQGAGVGMVRPGEQRLGRRGLHDAAEIHDHHPIRDVLDHAEVVADEQVG